VLLDGVLWLTVSVPLLKMPPPSPSPAAEPRLLNSAVSPQKILLLEAVLAPCEHDDARASACAE
jgi:hypothetical protein